MTVLHSVTVVLLLHLVQAYPYSSYSAKRYNRGDYQPAPAIPAYNLAQTYDNQEESPPAYRPSYYYYPYRPSRNSLPFEDNYSELPEDSSDPYQSAYPYGQELWYEGGPDAAANAAAAATREAILQNLIIAQMYEDAAASAAVNGFPLYPPQPSEERAASYQYGVPTIDIDEKERARQYLKVSEADEEVKELEKLRKPKTGNKEGKRRRKQKNKQAVEVQIPEKRAATATTATILALDNFKDGLPSSAPIAGGQKEFVLPQPARSRRPLIPQRREQPSVYQTIKQLLDVETNHKTEEPRLKKRFISTEEQLTQQLNNLRRSSMM